MIATENYKRELLFIFFVQKKLIIFCTAAIFILGILISFFWPPTYAAMGSVLIRGKQIEKSPESLENTHLRMFPVTKEDLFSEVEILTSHDNLLLALETLPAYRDTLDVYAVRDSIVTEVIPASKVIKITMLSGDQDEAVELLAAAMNTYVAQRSLVYNPVSAKKFFSDQATGFKDGLWDKEEEIFALVKANRVAMPDKEMENNLIIKVELLQQLNLLESQAIETGLFYEFLSEVLRTRDVKLFSTIDKLAINELSLKLADLIISRNKTLKTYLPSSEKIKAINESIDRAYAVLKKEVIFYRNEIANKRNTINHTIESIRQRLNNIADENVKLKRQSIETARIQREADTLEHSFKTFLLRTSEARINSSTDAANLFSISILSEAYPLKSAIFPKKRVLIPLSLLVGFIVGCSLGFLREYFNHTFKKPADIEQYLDVPVLLSISDSSVDHSSV